jgi:hypothetical protein
MRENLATNEHSYLDRPPKSLYEKIYCTRGQAENLIKAHKLHLASDRTSCTKATANQFRLLIHTAAYWLMLTLRAQAPRKSFWRDAQFDTIRLGLVKIAARVTEMVTRIKISLSSAHPYQAGFAMIASRVAKLPPRTTGPWALQSAASQTPSQIAPKRPTSHRNLIPVMNDPGWATVIEAAAVLM